jgi:ABC-type thiamine transport system ATPase subunit
VPTETPVKPLFHWLTVRRNVEFGFELKGTPAAERREITRLFVRQVGLEGFEHATPSSSRAACASGRHSPERSPTTPTSC